MRNNAANMAVKTENDACELFCAASSLAVTSCTSFATISTFGSSGLSVAMLSLKGPPELTLSGDIRQRKPFAIAVQTMLCRGDGTLVTGVPYMWGALANVIAASAESAYGPPMTSNVTV